MKWLCRLEDFLSAGGLIDTAVEQYGEQWLLMVTFGAQETVIASSFFYQLFSQPILPPSAHP